MTTLKPSEFFNKLDLSALDSNTATYIREEILTFDNLDLLDGTVEFETIKNMIEENFPKALGVEPKPIVEPVIEPKPIVEPVIEPKPIVEPEPEPEPEPETTVEDLESYLELIDMTIDGEEDKEAKEDLISYRELIVATIDDMKEKMANGGSVSEEFMVVLKTPKGLVDKKDFDGYTKEEIVSWGEERGWKYNGEAEKHGGQALKEDYEFLVKPIPRYKIKLPKEKYEDGGEMDVNPISFTENSDVKGVYDVLFDNNEIVVVDFSLDEFEDRRNEIDIFEQAIVNYEETYKAGGYIIRGRNYNDDRSSDGKRYAKPKGFRFKGDIYRRPTTKEINEFKGGKRDDIYFEDRPQRSDLKPFAKSGSRF